MSSTYPARYWEGIPLKEAVIGLAPAQLRQEYLLAQNREAAAHREFVRTRLLEIAASDLPPETKDLVTSELNASLFEDASELFAEDPLPSQGVRKDPLTRPSRAILDDMWMHLIDTLRAGTLVAIGYPLPRTADAPPQVVPPDVLLVCSHSDWSASTLAGNGLQFVGVRILMAYPPTNSDVSHEPPIPKKRGRSSRKAEVVEAYYKLFADGRIRPDDPYTAVHNEICKCLDPEGRNGQGLAYNTVQPFLTEIHPVSIGPEKPKN